MAKTSGKRHSIPPPSRHSKPAVAPRRSAPPPARASVRPAPAPAAPRRKFRGAAPWAARHAAKHAAEAAERNKEPPRPGSARATLRAPEEAERIKARVGELHDALSRLRAMKKQLPERFFEAGVLLRQIREARLFDAKGYASFEAFVERELDLGGKSFTLRLAKIPEIFLEEAARSHGLEALMAALEALDQALQRAAARPPTRARGG